MVWPHILMLKDKERLSSFQRAINEVVKSGDVVLDLGAGVGILGFFSLKAGASRCYFIEHSSAIDIAKDIALANDYLDRSIFIETPSLEVVLEEKVDVILCEMFGIFALEELIITYLGDARERFLKSDGVIIPKSVKLFMVPVESSSCFEVIRFCDSQEFQFNLSPLKRMTANYMYKTQLNPENFLSVPKVVREIDFYSITPRDGTIVDEIVSFEILNDGLLHGFLGWFDAILVNDILLSTSPLLPTTHWLQAYMPILDPVEVRHGDILETRITGISFKNKFLWNWQAFLFKEESIYKEGKSHSQPINVCNHSSIYCSDIWLRENDPRRTGLN